MRPNKIVIFKVFFACCVNTFLMEILMARQPSIANLITFLQFLFISTHGFITTTKFGTVSPNIPIGQYVVLVALFFVTSVANNYVYSLHVPSTLHMIIRSASSPASMIVSWMMKRKRPKTTSIIGSILVALGVLLATYGGAKVVEKRDSEYLIWSMGVILLLSTLFTGAFTGLQQEKLYKKYGSHPNEMLFYTNALPLPFFVTMYQSIADSVVKVNEEWLLIGWLTIAANILSQYYCAKSVHDLATEHTSVTVTTILTIRKFVSLLLSAVVFQSKFTFLHFLGTIFVVMGTYVYFDFFGMKINILKSELKFRGKNEVK